MSPFLIIMSVMNDTSVCMLIQKKTKTPATALTDAIVANLSAVLQKSTTAPEEMSCTPILHMSALVASTFAAITLAALSSDPSTPCVHA